MELAITIIIMTAINIYVLYVYRKLTIEVIKDIDALDKYIELILLPSKDIEAYTYSILENDDKLNNANGVRDRNIADKVESLLIAMDYIRSTNK